MLLRIGNVSDVRCRETQNTNFMLHFLFRKWCHLWDNVEKHCTARQATDCNIIRRVLFACWIPKATDTRSEYVILIAYPRKLCLREGASLLGFTYIACRVYFCLYGLSQTVQSYEVPCVYNPHDAFNINGNKIKIINTKRIALDIKNFGDRASIPGKENGLSHFQATKMTLCSIQSHIQWISGLLSPGIKRPQRESDHSALSRNQVKNVRSPISIYHYQ
jgi:hypothetical protein